MSVAGNPPERLVLGRARRRPWLHRLVGLAVASVLVASGPWLWSVMAAHGHVFDEANAPAADVVIVLGTEVAPDRQAPAERLAGRLQTAAALVHTGRSRVILVSGDGGGASGDEPTVMTSYLVAQHGIDARRIVADPYGLDTYDSCARARDVYGVTRALVVTQAYHLPRAVTVCRQLGLDVDGVAARCDGCSAMLLTRKAVRDYFASMKAAWDVVTSRPPAVGSPPDPAVRDALLALP
jgi:vancomycin permeability regulator SanA